MRLPPASGLSKRTVWRYFRSKEACIEPFFLVTGPRFIELLRTWPRNVLIEAYLRDALGTMLKTEQEIHTAYLMASAQSEDELVAIVAERAGRMREDFEVKLCAAVAMAAVRVVDQDICTATFIHGRHFELHEVCDQLAAAIRTASTLSICDPVAR